MKIGNVANLPEVARASAKTWRLCVAGPHDDATLDAVLSARRLGFVEPILFGDINTIESIAERLGEPLSPDIAIIETKDDNDTVRQSAKFMTENKADVLMKGLVSTGALMRAIIHSGTGPTGFVSHVAVFNEPGTGRLMLMSDGGINIAPNIARKVSIVKNAVAVARALGIERPRVAMLAAVEDLKYPSMPATLDAVLVSRIAASGDIPDAVVEGPFGLDNAISCASAETKGLEGREVAGRADILIVPEIETGNVFYKCLEIYCGVVFAGVVVGVGNPIAVSSRADSASTKLVSVALACLLSETA